MSSPETDHQLDRPETIEILGQLALWDEEMDNYYEGDLESLKEL